MVSLSHCILRVFAKGFGRVMTAISPEAAALNQQSRYPKSFRLSPEFAPGLMQFFEIATIATIGFFLCISTTVDQSDYIGQHAFCVAFICISYLSIGQWGQLSSLNALMRPIGQADNVVVAVITCFLFLMSVLYGLDVIYMFDAGWLLSFAAATVAGVLGVRIIGFFILNALSQRQIIGRRMAVLGANDMSARLLRKIARDRPYFTEVEGVFATDDEDRGSEWEGMPVLGGIQQLLDTARAGHIDDIVVARPWAADPVMTDMIEKLKELPVNVYLASELVGFDLTFKPILGTSSQVPVFEVTQRPIAGWSSAGKKLLDYVLASLALLIISPILLIVAIAIRLDSPGPVFFMQPRLGFNNKPFAIYKFRSMYHQEIPEARVRQATRRDPRVTRVGRIIRATSIDELPQLLNVLDGSMSLVGPRPHALSHNEEYGEQIRGYFARHKVKPGITGWAQVNGLRGETTDIELMRARVEHDVFYTENWSLFFDLKIIIMTAFVVLMQKTAY
jgi:Undecaprenyl-phosphate glucose phosphotransferase